jgi:dTDP-4-amino-4,6-dideoxygalactose transaminase
MLNTQIPFSKPFFPEESINQITEAMGSNHPHGDGPFSKMVEERLAKLTGTEVFLTGSCTQALEVATLALDLKPGDEVIIPSYTFPSGVTSLINYGVKPIFCDISLTDMNIDTSKIEDLISPKTRAISYVNYAGYSPDIDSLEQIAQKYDLMLIEDNAHGLGGSSGNRPLGSIGDLSTLSFHATKNIQCGEGGAICTNDTSLIERISIIREKGTNRRQFLLGDLQKYQWIDKGGSYIQSDLLASILMSQLSRFEFITEKRVSAWSYYDSALRSIFLENGFAPQSINNEAKNLGHMYWVLADTPDRRTDFLKHMASFGITCSFHYQSLGQSLAAMKYGYSGMNLPNSQIASTNLFRLPIWPQLSEKDLSIIVSAAKEFFIKGIS